MQPPRGCRQGCAQCMGCALACCCADLAFTRRACTPYGTHQITLMSCVPHAGSLAAPCHPCGCQRRVRATRAPRSGRSHATTSLQSAGQATEQQVRDISFVIKLPISCMVIAVCQPWGKLFGCGRDFSSSACSAGQARDSRSRSPFLFTAACCRCFQKCVALVHPLSRRRHWQHGLLKGDAGQRRSLVAARSQAPTVESSLGFAVAAGPCRGPR